MITKTKLYILIFLLVFIIGSYCHQCHRKKQPQTRLINMIDWTNAKSAIDLWCEIAPNEPNEWLTNCFLGKDTEDFRRETIRTTEIGLPQPTKAYTVKQLLHKNIIGIYATGYKENFDPNIIPDEWWITSGKPD